MRRKLAILKVLTLKIRLFSRLRRNLSHRRGSNLLLSVKPHLLTLQAMTPQMRIPIEKYRLQWMRTPATNPPRQMYHQCPRRPQLLRNVAHCWKRVTTLRILFLQSPSLQRQSLKNLLLPPMMYQGPLERPHWTLALNPLNRSLRVRVHPVLLAPHHLAIPLQEEQTLV